MSEKVSEKKGVSRTAAIALGIIIIVAVVIVGFVAFNQTRQTQMQPDIRVATVNGQGYWSGLTYMVRVTATITNYGDADGYATVEFHLAWSGQTQQSTQQVVFVGAHSSQDISANLPASALNTVTYGAQIIEQHKA